MVLKKYLIILFYYRLNILTKIKNLINNNILYYLIINFT